MEIVEALVLVCSRGGCGCSGVVLAVSSRQTSGDGKKPTFRELIVFTQSFVLCTPDVWDGAWTCDLRTFHTGKALLCSVGGGTSPKHCGWNLQTTDLVLESRPSSFRIQLLARRHGLLAHFFSASVLHSGALRSQGW